MKHVLSLAIFGLWALGTPADGRNMGLGGHPAGEGPVPRMPSAAHRKAFESCLSAKGVKPPAHPKLTDAQRASADKCRSEAKDRESFGKCMNAVGIAPPPRPDSQTLAALKACHEEARQAP